MISKIVWNSEPITLVGGGEVDETAIKRAVQIAPCVVAADGGAGAALRAGQCPAAVIGDMDSIEAAVLSKLVPETVHRITEQDSTDFEKCLLRIQAPVVVGLGFLGGRLDHQLAAFHALMRFPEQRCVLFGAQEIVFLCPERLDLALAPGTPVSLFPLAPVTGAMEGLKWSFKALAFAPGARIGTSNMALGPVRLQMSDPAMLCILPSACLEDVVTALAAVDSWPARG